MEKNFRLVVGLSVPGGLLITLRGHLEMIQDWVRLVSTAPLKLLSSDWPFESKCLQGGGWGASSHPGPLIGHRGTAIRWLPQWYPPARGGVALAVARRPPPKRGVTPFAAQGMVLPPPPPTPRAVPISLTIHHIPEFPHGREACFSLFALECSQGSPVPGVNLTHVLFSQRTRSLRDSWPGTKK